MNRRNHRSSGWGTGAILLQKEATFLLNCYVIAMSEAFSQIEYVKPTKDQFRMSPDFIFGDNYISSLKKLLTSIERITPKLPYAKRLGQSLAPEMRNYPQSFGRSHPDAERKKLVLQLHESC